MTDEDRKPASDEARGVYAIPPWRCGLGGGDGESSTTSEFALPEGMAPPRPVVGEAETTSEFALPDGLDVPQPPRRRLRWTGLGLQHPAYVPGARVHARPWASRWSSLTKDVPWQDRMRTMLRMPVAERPAPERLQKAAEDDGPAVPRVLDLTLRIGELLLAGGEGAEDVEAAMFAVCRSVRPRPLRAERHLHPAVDLVPALAGRRPGDGVTDRPAPGHRLHAPGGRLPAGGRHQRLGDRRRLAGGGLPAPRGDPA